jgi:hypothetical protein
MILVSDLIDEDYEVMASICLKADGGHCEHCAKQVAEGFKSRFPIIDLDKLDGLISRKIDEYYNHGNNKTDKQLVW